MTDNYITAKKESNVLPTTTVPAHKPPIGTIPYWYRAEERITELIEAIHREANEQDSMDTRIVKIWANEIILQCTLIETLKKKFET